MVPGKGWQPKDPGSLLKRHWKIKQRCVIPAELKTPNRGNTANEVLPTTINEEIMSMTSKAPSLTESGVNNMQKIFEAVQKPLGSVLHADQFSSAMTYTEKCKTWLQSNSQSTAVASDPTESDKSLSSLLIQKQPQASAVDYNSNDICEQPDTGLHSSGDLCELRPAVLLSDAELLCGSISDKPQQDYNHNFFSELDLTLSDNIVAQSVELSIMQPVPLTTSCSGGKSTLADFPKEDKISASEKDNCLEDMFINLDPIMITPQESSTVAQNHCRPKTAYDNTDGTSLQVFSACPSSPIVKRNLFPNDASEISEPSLNKNLSVNDVDNSVLPLRESSILEDVIPLVVSEENIEHSLETQQPETEERNVTQEKNRKRSSTPAEKPLTRKRKVIPENWKRTKAKVAYNAGLAHVSKKGIEKKARSVKPPCAEKCRQKCFSRVSLATRQTLFDKYWRMNQDRTSQWLFLAKLVKIVNIKQRKVELVQDEAPWRKHSYEYYLKEVDDEENLIPVCQTMFVNTFDISVKSVRTALAKNSPDKRGKHANHRKVLPRLQENVIEHIKKFPMVQSHYCRADTKRGYLDENLSVAKMHRMYLMEQEEGAPTATERQYREIFNNNFNLSFFKPKKDQCSFCLAFDAPDAEKTEEKINQYNLHQHEKQRVREMKKADKELSRKEEISHIRVVTFDLQKILYSPKGENAEFYYKRKFSSFNFTLMDCTEKQAYCYVWDLTVGKKGADEVASFVFDYIQAMVEKGIKDFRFYSDSCTAQNKNKFLFSMYYMAVMKFKVKITHTWLVKGHTQMECDNVHARIEKKTKNMQIYTSSQWYGAIRSAKVKKPAYIVKEAGKDVQILTFRPLEKHFNWGKVPIAKLRRITVDCNEPSDISFQTECDGLVTKHGVLTKKAGRPINWTTFKLEKAYAGKLPLKPKVVNDLKWYVQKGFIPDAHLDFYRYLVEDPADNVEEFNESDDEDDVPQVIVPPPKTVAHQENDMPQENNDMRRARQDQETEMSDGDISNEDDDFDEN